ncbi:AMP-binding protein [Nocardia brasiliensis]|uniref:AMP-binding protein n=1 Tax=Nocardia brasiliensis TaxID=37326 RepID=UPI002457308E|nr:AMP-binding protein [Nocardia brasiliensis]
MRDDKDVAAVRNWLADPAAAAGIHLADEADGWEYRSYAELAESTWSIAALMRAHGMSSGDGACVIMPTGFPCVAAFYAVWACGGVFTPVAPPMFGDLEQIIAHIAGILSQAQPRLVVTSIEFEQLVRQAATAAGRTDEPLVIDAAALPECPPEQRVFGEPDECALLQFTSGSTAAPRGVRVSWHNLANNIAMISALVEWEPGEAMVSWLPLYHDMGLVGAFLTTVTNQGDLYLMRPDQFVRDPVRWLRAMAHAQHSPSPSFALGYVAHRVSPAEIADLDLSGWRTLAVGSEPVEVADLQSFAELAGPQGFSMSAYTLAYGLAESTLMVTSSARHRPITALRIDTSTLRFGEPVTVLEERLLDDTHRVEGAGWITGLGYATPESTVTVVDDEGRPLPDGTLGEMVVMGDSVALGYSDESESASTRILDGALHSGDAGFLHRGEVFVLGRMGSSLKVRGRSVFMEDIESRVAQETGITKGKLAAVAITEPGAQGIALFAESKPGDWIAEARKIIRSELGPAQTVTIVTGPRGIIRRTSSGKPRRRHMWEQFRGGALADAVAHEERVGAADAGPTRGSADPDLPVPTMALDRAVQLLDKALDSVAVPRDSTVLFEGSLAEGFGNDGSDVDFLVLAPGDDELPTLPTVLFIDGRRVEVRTRSAAQLRRQLEQVAQATSVPDLDEDLLNRCQRFLRATVVRAGSQDVGELRALLPHAAFTGLLAEWWHDRARHALRYAVALRALHARDEAVEWARDGLLQAMKGWAARRGESYVETKWLPRQLDRIGADELVDRYRALADPAAWASEDTRDGGDVRPDAPARAVSGDATWAQLCTLAGELGVTGVVDDPDQILFARMPEVTTWHIGPRIHVMRDSSEVFVLSDDAARAWRSVVFRHSIAAVLDRAQHDSTAALAEFLRLGFVGLQWRGGEVLTPALALCKQVRPYTPVPSAISPALGVTGAVREQAIATLSPLPARRFTECALNLVWSNIVLENAREDLAGAIKNAQGAVADIAAHRMIAMAVRVVLSAYGIHPLPADVAPSSTLARLLPSASPHRDDLLARLESARRVRFSQLVHGGDTLSGLAVLDEFVTLVRSVAADPAATGFPASFDSREQWRRTLAIGYDWLRIAGYLDTELPLDEARDLLASGGQQPHLRDEEVQA